MIKKSYKIASVIIISCLALGMMSCSSSSSGGGGSAKQLSISGGFSALSFTSSREQGTVYPFAPTDYTIVCNLLVDPFTSDSSQLDASGSFTLTIAGGEGLPVGCFLTKSGKVAGVFEFETSGSGDKGSGLPVNSGTTKITLPTDLSLGANGVVNIPFAGIEQDSNQAPAVSWVDPTGTWTISRACLISFSEETGEPASQCMPPEQTGGEIPNSVYLQQVTASHNSLSQKSGLAIWASQSARSSCGNVEGSVTLPPGYTEDGNWNSAFSGGGVLNLSTTANVDTAAAHAYADTWEGGQSFCNAQNVTEGVTKCSDINWSGLGTNWGMTDAACKLHCVLSAVDRGRSSHPEINFFDWEGYNGSPVTCFQRYKMNGQFYNEFNNDKDWDLDNGIQVGALNDGKCDGVGNGCYDEINSQNTPILQLDKRGPQERFMFGLLNTVGNVGTMIESENTGKHGYQNAAQNGSISCGGTNIEKLTMILTASNTAEITVEHSFIPDADNDVECASNSDFESRSENGETFVLKVKKQ